jgi:hypothetical protein
MDDFLSIKDIAGVDKAIELQRQKLETLRKDVKGLKFKKIDIAGSYASVSYKAIDGGNMRINLNPFEINVISVADSNGRKKLSFVVPEIKGYGDTPEDKKEALKEIVKEIDEKTIIQKFVNMLKCSSISEVSYILNNSNSFMEIAEWACIFDRIESESNEPIIIIKDGLLRTKVLMASEKFNHIKTLKEILKRKKKDAKLVGVSKTSAILSLLSTALFLEKKIPSDAIGYVKIPLELELKAYRWEGSGKIDRENVKPLNYAFGEIYIAKLSKDSNLLVTIEIPKDLETGESIYSESEIEEMISYLAKDAKFSYPVIGYPQTIMRAHEVAVQMGFPASVIRDEIRDKIIAGLDNEVGDFIRDGWLLTDFVDKGVLGGGHYG